MPGTNSKHRGHTVHTPTLRYHDLPLAEGAGKVGPVSLRDYADDVVALVESLDSPPLLVGHSLGGLVAQLVAARAPHAGVVAATPGPAAGIFPMYPGRVRVFGRHYLQRRPWAKPLPPATWKVLRRYVTNTTDETLARALFSQLVCDSGRAYCELALPRSWTGPRPPRSTSRPFTAPVLAIGGERDRLVNLRSRPHHGGALQEWDLRRDSRVRPYGAARKRAARHDGPHRRVDGTPPGLRPRIESTQLEHVLVSSPWDSSARHARRRLRRVE